MHSCEALDCAAYTLVVGISMISYIELSLI